jgi:hypothetical protein
MSPWGAPPGGAAWTDAQRKALGAEILLAADDDDLSKDLLDHAVKTVNDKHSVSLKPEGLNELLGLPTTAAYPAARQRLAARILSKAKGHPVDNDGLMCGCGG